MAAFCTPRFYHGASAEPIAIKGLFHLLDSLQDDLTLQSVLQESLGQQQQKSSPTSSPAAKEEQPLPFFTPRFDISETDSAYHLNGDLAGLSKEHIDIDFTDAQTITVRGKVLRSAPASPATTQASEDVIVEDAAPSSPVSSASSHHATVEDDFEDLAAETSTVTSSTSAASTPGKTQEKPAAAPKQEPQQPEPKYWISERKHGQFARSFKFRKTVDVAGVSASLDNGVLSIVVPKKNESRKIFVQ